MTEKISFEIEEDTWFQKPENISYLFFSLRKYHKYRNTWPFLGNFGPFGSFQNFKWPYLIPLGCQKKEKLYQLHLYLEPEELLSDIFYVLSSYWYSSDGVFRLQLILVSQKITSFNHLMRFWKV